MSSSVGTLDDFSPNAGLDLLQAPYGSKEGEVRECHLLMKASPELSGMF